MIKILNTVMSLHTCCCFTYFVTKIKICTYKHMNKNMQIYAVKYVQQRCLVFGYYCKINILTRLINTSNVCNNMLLKKKWNKKIFPKIYIKLPKPGRVRKYYLK